MRKYSLAVIIILFLLSLAGCDITAWRNYHSSEDRFSLRIPRSWDIDEDAADASLVAYIPASPRDDHFASNIRVVVDSLPVEIPLSTYYDINRAEFEQVFKKLIDIEEGQGLTGLVRYQWFAFNAQLTEDVLVRIVSVVWMKGKRVYILTCVMNLRRASEIEPIFRKVISSFRIH
jgi:hypothetical protein